MEILFGLFALSWIFGFAVGALILMLSERLPQAWRILGASFGTAIFCTPSLGGAHGGMIPLPGILVLAAQPDDRSIYLTFFVPTWLICAAIYITIGLIKPSRKNDFPLFRKRGLKPGKLK